MRRACRCVRSQQNLQAVASTRRPLANFAVTARNPKGKRAPLQNAPDDHKKASQVFTLSQLIPTEFLLSHKTSGKGNTHKRKRGRC